MKHIEITARFLYRVEEHPDGGEHILVREEIEEHGLPQFMDEHEEDRWACEVVNVKDLTKEE